MQWLEHRIPPPIIGLLVGVAMWGGARISPPPHTEAGLRVGVALAFAVVGLVIMLLGVMAFRRALTTVNPLKPESASSLVVRGIYRYTRNPMYVGFASVLAAWAVYLAAPPVWIGPVLFILFITRFQIIPEERALSKKFGQEFAEYMLKVRRWL